MNLLRNSGATSVAIERTSPSSPGWNFTNVAHLTTNLVGTRVAARSQSTTKKEKGGANVTRTLFSVVVYAPVGDGSYKPITCNLTVAYDSGSSAVTPALVEEAIGMCTQTANTERARLARGES